MNLLGGLLGSLGRTQVLDNLLLLDQESADDSLTNTAVTSRSTVGTGNSLLSLLQSTLVEWTNILDLRKSI